MASRAEQELQSSVHYPKDHNQQLSPRDQRHQKLNDVRAAAAGAATCANVANVRKPYVEDAQTHPSHPAPIHTPTPSSGPRSDAFTTAQHAAAGQQVPTQASVTSAIVPSTTADLRHAALEVLDAESNIDLPEEIDERVQQIYEDMMPLLKLLFEAYVQNRENSVPFSMESELRQLEQLNQRIYEISPNSSLNLLEIMDSLMNVVQYVVKGNSTKPSAEKLKHMRKAVVCPQINSLKQSVCSS